MAEQSKKRSREETDGLDTDTSSNKIKKIGPSISFADVLSEMEGAAGQWGRSSVDINSDNKNRIMFQHFDTRGSISSNGIATIKLFGSTEAGHSILVHVMGFMHYFYFPSPSELVEDDLGPLATYLNGLLKNPAVKVIELVKKKIRASEANFLKIFVSDPRRLKDLQDESLRVFERGLCSFRNWFTSPEVTYESTLDYSMRFMLDKRIVGMSWIELPPDKYTILSSRDKQSRCQLEVTIGHEDLISWKPDSGWSKIAPLRILSFDIEIKQLDLGLSFPDAHVDPVIQIANMVTQYGEKRPFIRNVFTLGTCAPIEGSQILSYESEDKLLQGWKDFVNEVDPDVVTGYNIARFDIPYLFIRASTLKLENFNIGRSLGIPMRVPRMPCNKWDNGLYISGRVCLDLYHFISTNYPLHGHGAYKLGAVSKHFLGQNKEDVHFSRIGELQDGTPETRRQLAIYCAKDAYLPQLLMDKLKYIESYIQVARNDCVPFNGMVKPEKTVRLVRLLSDAIREGRILSDPLFRGI